MPSTMAASPASESPDDFASDCNKFGLASVDFLTIIDLFKGEGVPQNRRRG
jgi:hypothetical protein